MIPHINRRRQAAQHRVTARFANADNTLTPVDSLDTQLLAAVAATTGAATATTAEAALLLLSAPDDSGM